MAIYARLENGTYAEVTGVYKADGTEVTEIFQGDRLVYSASNEIYGTLPLYYNGKGYDLTDYLISGDTVQDGTTSPDAPVDAAGSGVMTGNLFDGAISETSRYLNSEGNVFASSSFNISDYIPCDAETTYTIENVNGESSSPSVCFYSSQKIFLGGVNYNRKSGITFETPVDCSYLKVSYRKDKAESAMLNLGSEALPYEPYGYKLPLTVNDTEYPIYLGQVETTRRIKKLVLTGEETVTAYTGYDAENCFFVFKSGMVAGIGLCNFYSNVKNLGELIREDNSFMNSTNTVRIHDSRFVTPDDFKSYLSAQYAAGTPVTVWYVLAEPETAVVNEPLHKIGDYADTISFAQAGVTIPTVNGANVLDMASTVKPSEMYIKGKGIKPTGYGQLVDKNSVRILDKNDVCILVHGQ